jgi:hypothetical protein
VAIEPSTDRLRHGVRIFAAMLPGFEAQAGAVHLPGLRAFVRRHLCDIWSGQGAFLSGAGVFTRADLIRLAALLSEIAGKFLLSVNDVPENARSILAVRNPKRGDVLHRFRLQRDRCRGDRGDRPVTGCGATGARSVIAVMKHCTS